MNEQNKQTRTPERPASELTQADPTPDTPFLEIGDFEDYVAFYTKCDIIEHGSQKCPIKTSQKKCRFCD